MVTRQPGRGAWDPVAAGARLAQARQDAGLTQAEVGVAAGLCRSSIANIEAGRQQPTPTSVAAVALVVDADPGWLLFGEREGTGPDRQLSVASGQPLVNLAAGMIASGEWLAEYVKALQTKVEAT